MHYLARLIQVAQTDYRLWSKCSTSKLYDKDKNDLCHSIHGICALFIYINFVDVLFIHIALCSGIYSWFIHHHHCHHVSIYNNSLEADNKVHIATSAKTGLVHITQ